MGLHRYWRDCLMVTYTTTWTSASGEHEVKTTRRDGESSTQHAERHRDEVSALQVIYPKIA